MDYDLAQIAERLFADFNGQVPLTTVITVLRECAAKYPENPPELIEQAARIQLQIRNQGQSQ
jgi:hypothetical protein